MALWLSVVWVGASAPSVAAAQAAHDVSGDLASAPPTSEAVVEVADWVAATRDNRGLPYMIIDKVSAQVVVFGADGQLRGATPALLGVARGDRSLPGIGDLKLSDIRPEDRTTPAGRFLAAYGPAIGSKDVLWVDYDTAVSLHPVVTSNPKERRLQRLKSPSPDDNRITYGCINVASGFYDEVVHPAFTGTDGIVYVLPESEPLSAFLPSFQARSGSASAKLP